MSNDRVQPDMMDALEREMSFIETQAGGKSSRVKIPKGHLWRVRFLPVEQGASKMWWGRYIFHWINNRPYLCPRTPEDFGGLGDSAPCPLCDTADALNRDRDQFVSRIGYKAMALPQWLLYSLVVSKYDGEREILTKEPELWKPWEFWLTKASMADVSQLYKQYRRRGHAEGPDYSFLDLLEGCTVAVKCKKNGMRFTPERPGPILDVERYDEIVNYIWGQIKFPDHKVPSERDLNLLARKLEEYAYEGGGEDDRRGGGARRRDNDDDDDDDDRRGGSRGDYDEDRDDRRGGRDRGDYDEDRDDRRGGRERADDRRDRADDRRSDERRAPSAPPAPPAPAQSRGPAPRPAPPMSAPAPAAPRPAPPSRAVPAPPAASRSTPPSASRPIPPPPAKAGGPAQSSVSDDEDNAPEEARDPAPPADPSGDLPPVAAEGAPEAGAPAPAAPSPAPPPPPRSLSERLRNGISAAAKR